MTEPCGNCGREITWIASDGKTGSMIRGWNNLDMTPHRCQVHLQDYKHSMDTSLCGGRGRIMSHHELKRNRITCSRCVYLYHFPPISGGTALEPSGSQVER